MYKKIGSKYLTDFSQKFTEVTARICPDFPFSISTSISFYGLNYNIYKHIQAMNMYTKIRIVVYLGLAMFLFYVVQINLISFNFLFLPKSLT